MTDVSIPETDSSATLHDNDLIPVFRASEKDTAGSNYGLYAQEIGDFKPEYRNTRITLTVAAGAVTTAEASRTLSVASSRFDSPTLVWVVTHAAISSTGVTTLWYSRGRYQDNSVATGQAARSWYYAKELASTNERMTSTASTDRSSQFKLGTNRVPASAAGGWDLVLTPETRVLNLVQDGTAPQQAYSFVVEVAYALI